MIIGLSRLIDIIVSLNRRFRQAQIEKKLKQRYVSVDPFSLYNNDITELSQVNIHSSSD